MPIQAVLCSNRPIIFIFSAREVRSTIPRGTWRRRSHRPVAVDVSAMDEAMDVATDGNGGGGGSNERGVAAGGRRPRRSCRGRDIARDENHRVS